VIFLVVVLVVVVEDAVGVDVVLAVESIFMVVSIAAGAGAIAGAAVSAVAVSSFFEHAASTRTAATRARRFIYDLLGRQRGIIRRSVHAIAVPVFGAAENLSHLEAVSRAEPSGCHLMRGLD
jgi:hypothetical protein